MLPRSVASGSSHTPRKMSRRLPGVSARNRGPRGTPGRGIRGRAETLQRRRGQAVISTSLRSRVESGVWGRRGGPRALACACGIARHGSQRRFQIGSTSGPDGVRSGSGAEPAQRCGDARRCTRPSEQPARARSARIARSSRARSAHGYQRPWSGGSSLDAGVSGSFSREFPRSRLIGGSTRSIQRSGGGTEGGKCGGRSGSRARLLGEPRAMRSIQRTAAGTETGRRAGRSAGRGHFFRNLTADGQLPGSSIEQLHQVALRLVGSPD